MTPHHRISVEAEKKLLRAKALRSRDELLAAERCEKSLRIIDRLFALPGIRDLQCWFVYVSFKSEVETHGLIRRLLAEGKKVAVPCIDRAKNIIAPSRIGDFDLDLAPGSLGIREPKPGRLEPVASGDIDIVIAPGAAFAADGSRIGYGGGYYDRFFKSCEAVSIGLAYDMQVFDRIACDALRDMPLSYIVTESRLIRCTASGP